MKKFAFILAAVMMMAFTTTASAQFMGGNGGGRQVAAANVDAFSAAWVVYSPTSFKEGSHSSDGYNTFSFGITHATPLASIPLLLEYGAYADWTTKTRKDGSVSSTFNLAGVKVPVNLMYPLELANNMVVYPYAGLNARVFVLGNYKYKYEGNSHTDSIFDEDSYMKRFSLGYQLGVRARFNNLIAGIGYEDMLTSIYKDSGYDYKAKFNYITISLGFVF